MTKVDWSTVLVCMLLGVGKGGKSANYMMFGG